MPSLISQILNGTAQRPTQPQPQNQFQQNYNTQYIQNLKNAMDFIQASKNPQALQNFIQQNPYMAQVKNLLSQNNNNMKQAFFSLASSYGVNPNDILQLLK